jgi:hypothetical protein
MVEIWGKFALDFLCYIKNIKILFQNKEIEKQNLAKQFFLEIGNLHKNVPSSKF